VDDLRVVGVIDPSMTRAQDPRCCWARQEELVVSEKVWENLDRLACALTGIRQARDAWRAIFVKPPRRGWSEVVVALKINHIGRQHTRSAVLAKVCDALMALGIEPSNIHIYDACHGAGMARETPFKGLPKGVRIEETWGGSQTLTAVPEPWKGGRRKARCLKPLVNGTVDILLNIAMCKGHRRRFGGFTMTLKNHFGTFSPAPGHRSGSQDYLIAINQTPEILGSMDPRTGRILHPRQQLCIVDALWASECGPICRASHQPNALFMGVFAPAVDYQVAVGFRKRRMGWEIDTEATRRILRDFGHNEEDLPKNEWLAAA
jgi:hypothetical protein